MISKQLFQGPPFNFHLHFWDDPKEPARSPSDPTDVGYLRVHSKVPINCLSSI